MASTMDIDLLKKLRSDNFDKYQQVVNMHLSRTNIDLTADEMDALWAVEQSKKGQASPSFFNLEPSAFGQAIREKFKLGRGKSPFRSKSPRASSVERQERLFEALRSLIDFLCKDDVLANEGIFRKAGSQSRQQAVSSMLTNGESIDFEEAFNEGQISVHDIATVLKNTLGDLPQPLLSDAHHRIYVTVASWETDSEHWSTSEIDALIRRQLRVVRLIILMLPCHTYDLLYDLFRLIQRTASHSALNKMTDDNLAVVFAPSLLFPRCAREKELAKFSVPLTKLLATMIRRVDDVFTVPPELVRDVRHYYQNRGPGVSPATTPRMDSSSKKPCLSAANDDGIVKTTVTFVDTMRSARDKQAITTESEVAQLYAHVHSMPDSKEKARMLKNFREYNRTRLLDNTNDRRKSVKRKAAAALDHATPSHVCASEDTEINPLLKKPKIVWSDIDNCAFGGYPTPDKTVLSPSSDEFLFEATSSPIARTSTIRFMRSQDRLLPPPMFDISAVSPTSTTTHGIGTDENARSPSRMQYRGPYDRHFGIGFPKVTKL